MKITSKLTINKPVKVVWNFFDNPDNMKLWLTGFQKFEPISGTPGEVGAKSKHTYLDRGRTIELIEEITKKVPLKEFHGMLTHASMTSAIQNTFDSQGTATSITCEADIQFKSLPFKLLSPLMKGMFQKRQDNDLNTFKTLIEKL